MIKVYATLAQARAKVAYQEHCPIGQLLGAGDGAHLEYKSTFRTAAVRSGSNDQGAPGPPLESRDPPCVIPPQVTW